MVKLKTKPSSNSLEYKRRIKGGGLSYKKPKNKKDKIKLIDIVPVERVVEKVSECIPKSITKPKKNEKPIKTVKKPIKKRSKDDKEDIEKISGDVPKSIKVGKHNFII